jgi:hypothetical protein
MNKKQAVKVDVSETRRTLDMILQQLVAIEAQLPKDESPDDAAGEWLAAVGTQDAPAPLVVAKPPRAPALAERAEDLLRARPLSTPDLAGELGAPVGHASRAVQALRRAGRLTNAGTADEPRWFLPPGDGASPADLNAAVLALIEDAPRTHRELMALTLESNPNRVTRSINVARERLVNLGDRNRAVWAARDRVLAKVRPAD